MRLIWTAAGTVFLAIGIAGVILPMLPGTIFLFAASACFLRGSERLHRWLNHHPVLGHHIRVLTGEEPMPLRSKVFAISAMWMAVAISVWKTSIVPMQISLIVLAVIGTFVISRRK